MPVENADIATIFDEVADLLEISGASFFRVRAYRNASRVIRDLSRSLASMTSEPGFKLEDLPGVGKDLAAKIREILETGDLRLRRDLERDVPVGLIDVTRVAGLGPRKAHALFLELGVTDLESLGTAAKLGEIQGVKGFGPKTEANILEGIYAVKGLGNRTLWADAERKVRAVMEHMSAVPGLKRLEAAGSFRRRVETVGDLDILVVCDDPDAAAARFVTIPGVSRVVARGPTRSSVVVDGEFQVDLRVVEEDSFGAAMQYFTGSQAHSVALRSMALRKGLKLNEYGVFRDDEKIAGATEEEVYGALGLPLIPPELRENRGEIGAALEGRLPSLVEQSDVRGDLHLHTDATDGRASLADIAAAAKRKGYLYAAVTDHSKRVAMVKGLDERALLSSWREIEKLNERMSAFHLLKGVEVDVLEDGSLDIADDVLSRADFVIASVHYNTNMTRARMTRRIVKALENPHVDALAHPSGRKLNKRPPYQVNMEEVIAAAARFDAALELNSAPRRLDIDDQACRSARDHGVKVCISTDAHDVSELDFMRYGLNQARRGWLEKDDVLNCLTYRSLMKRLRH
jgi:DNA polymerase (family 10)